MTQDHQDGLLADGKSLFDVITRRFARLSDPRAADNQTYSLAQLIFCILIGSLNGCNNLEEIHTYLQAKRRFILRIMSMSSIPSKSTLWNLLILLNPKQFEEAFLEWISEATLECGGELIAIDGKALRATCRNGKPNSCLHIVHAWGCTNRLLLGQTRTEEKSNEITAIPELLKALSIQGNVISIDAAGCQKNIAKYIVSQEGDYVLALKGNQGNLHKDVELYFDGLSQKELNKLGRHTEHDKGHGRIEQRTVHVETGIDWLTSRSRWSGLTAIIMIESVRRIAGMESRERRYYITSLDETAEKLLNYIRGHWAVENNLHWSLDVVFREDACRANKGNIAENLALFCRWTLNILQRAGPKKMGPKKKRQTAGWND